MCKDFIGLVLMSPCLSAEDRLLPVIPAVYGDFGNVEAGMSSQAHTPASDGVIQTAASPVARLPSERQR